MHHRLPPLLFACAFLGLAVMRGQTPPVRMPPGLVLVAKVAGTGTMTVGGATSPLKADDRVTQASMIATGQDSLAVLVFANGATLQLGANTELAMQEFLQEPFGATVKVADLEEEPSLSQTRLTLNQGELVGNVKRLKQDRGSSFLVKTAGGVATISGGTFRIATNPASAGEKLTTLSTAAGEAGFVPTTGDDTNRQERVTVRPGQEIKIAPPTNADGKVSLELIAGAIAPENLKRIITGASVIASAVGPRSVRRPEGDQQPDLKSRSALPKPRLVKTVQSRPAVLAENRLGTTNIGPTAVDAKWSNYGAYLQRMIDTVQIQWERTIIEQKTNPAPGSLVTVKFVMNDQGRIVEIAVVESTANATATRACVSAVTDRMPFGPWTDDMKAALGERQEMTFTFHYQ